MRVREVEVIARALEVRGHGGEVLCSILAVVAPTHLDAGDLGDGVGLLVSSRGPEKREDSGMGWINLG